MPKHTETNFLWDISWLLDNSNGAPPPNWSLEIGIRLGGFHTLMSYVGSIGNLMTGSGIEQVLQLMFGKDVVPHIISGKAISRALRWHFMVEAGLNNILLTQVIPPEGIDDIMKEVKRVV